MAAASLAVPTEPAPSPSQPLLPPPSPPAAIAPTHRPSSPATLSRHGQVRTSGDAAEAIEFHWDCDEYCCDVHDVHVSPALSSVTYLGDCGAPTLVLAVPSPHRASHDLAAAHGPIEAGTLSYPRVRATGLQPQASAAHARLLLTRAPRALRRRASTWSSTAGCCTARRSSSSRRAATSRRTFA